MPATDKRPLKVFLCHASTDKPKVRELYRYLKKRGIQPWFDEEDLVGGQDWQIEIPKALATSDAIIICLTKNSVDKEGYIQKEIKFALDKALEMPEGRIFLIPVKFEECEVPFTLSRYQWVDLTVESGYAKMMKALKFRASSLVRSTVEFSKTDNAQDNYEQKMRVHNEERKVPTDIVVERATKRNVNNTNRINVKKSWASRVVLGFGSVVFGVIIIGMMIFLSQVSNPFFVPTPTATIPRLQTQPISTTLPPSETLMPKSTMTVTSTFTLSPTLTQSVTSTPTTSFVYCSWGKDVGGGYARYECGCAEGSCSCSEYLYSKKTDYQNNKQKYIYLNNKSYTRSYVNGQVSQYGGSCSGN